MTDGRAEVPAMAYTVGQVAEQLGITVRTLHHYHRIGLLVPSERSASGYRLYTEDDLVRLQHIVVYRRLELPLEEIAQLLESGDAATHLRRQRAAVMARLDEMNRLVTAIDNALEKTMADQPMTTDDMKQLFGESYEERQAEAQERWGDTDAWKESQRRAKTYTQADWAQIKAEGDQIQARLAALFKARTPADNVVAADAVEAHREHMTRWFYDVSPQMHRALGDMYVADPRYTKAYDDAFDAPGLAEWVRDAIHASSERAGQD
ncbi:MerR family transcriptional regulator [Luteipulveratus flavus]|uniref:MerR family transcriptional regulator n=1 Tax=Luteipulveratus flavus TaxID=3031728 RepID=A0ABT6C8W5_9MICO|nr:MerR family transcriptional regulator [Luteipulveratus sp. YIM 133296]MDF8264767.1 MerR family transcriptional regulator [Luteipulveratus sp. YIM 133296]